MLAEEVRAMLTAVTRMSDGKAPIEAADLRQ